MVDILLCLVYIYIYIKKKVFKKRLKERLFLKFWFSQQLHKVWIILLDYSLLSLIEDKWLNEDTNGAFHSKHSCISLATPQLRYIVCGTENMKRNRPSDDNDMVYSRYCICYFCTFIFLSVCLWHYSRGIFYCILNTDQQHEQNLVVVKTVKNNNI